LQPGEKRVVRIYLKEYVGKPYSFTVNGDSVEWEDFANLYWGDLGKSGFRVFAGGYNLPDPKQAAKAQGFKEEVDHIYTFSYDNPSSGDYFEQVPCQAYQ
ncbi:MAG: hypothetical protein ACYC21_10825, partial [Eubacteriales bacterium]